eukprot:6704776-Pyramimonas_sp.AAC.1
MFCMRKQLKISKSQAREKWVEAIILELQKATAQADLGYFYKLMKKFGAHARGKSRRGQDPSTAE